MLLHVKQTFYCFIAPPPSDVNNGSNPEPTDNKTGNGDNPNGGDVPKTDDNPNSGDVPKTGDKPNCGDVPKTGDKPNGGDVPKTGDKPNGGDVPKNGENTPKLANGEQPNGGSNEDVKPKFFQGNVIPQSKEEWNKCKYFSLYFVHIDNR